MILYHGSNLAIEIIDLAKSKPFKDFGKGFYLSHDFDQAKKMAETKADLLGGKPFVSSFNFDKEALLDSDLDIKIFPEYSEEWVDFIIENREGRTEKIYDYVYGPIADDDVGFQLRQIKNGLINKSQLMEALKYRKGITFQHFFGTPKALEFLTKIYE